VRELALFNLGIDSKLRGCDLVSLKVRDVCHGDQVATRAVVMQRKTQRPASLDRAADAGEDARHSQYRARQSRQAIAVPREAPSDGRFELA